jgi:hypothetical protein
MLAAIEDPFDFVPLIFHGAETTGYR